MDVTKWLDIPTMTCWSVNRGQGLTPIISCEGVCLRVMHTFYYYITEKMRHSTAIAAIQNSFLLPGGIIVRALDFWYRDSEFN